MQPTMQPKPNGKALLPIAGINGLAGIQIVPHLLYPFFLLVSLLISIGVYR